MQSLKTSENKNQSKPSSHLSIERIVNSLNPLIIAQFHPVHKLVFVSLSRQDRKNPTMDSKDLPISAIPLAMSRLPKRPILAPLLPTGLVVNQVAVRRQGEAPRPGVFVVFLLVLIVVAVVVVVVVWADVSLEASYDAYQQHGDGAHG